MTMTCTLQEALAHVDHELPGLESYARADWAYHVREAGIRIDPDHCMDCATQLSDYASEADAESGWLRVAEHRALDGDY